MAVVNISHNRGHIFLLYSQRHPLFVMAKDYNIIIIVYSYFKMSIGLYISANMIKQKIIHFFILFMKSVYFTTDGHYLLLLFATFGILLNSITHYIGNI